MKKIPLIATAALAVALSGCSSGKKAPEPAASSETAAPSVTESALSQESASAQDSIPEGLRGRWGLVPADCTSTRGDAKGLLTISADQLEFYESVAKLSTVKSHKPEMVTATFDFSGEGQSWVLDVTLSSPDGGKTLVRKDTGPDAAPEPLTYTKCP